MHKKLQKGLINLLDIKKVNFRKQFRISLYKRDFVIRYNFNQNKMELVVYKFDDENFNKTR
ncbi:unnamed protein product [Paramecium sonneborni]|uniref:Uncharacterized protein n=1 Tax=Paramecium sonneborni TaxID=65129 RepID=A0A8S1QKC9_9CILI|nr:unnamed protein product [Paramecium sonneborni]